MRDDTSDISVLLQSHTATVHGYVVSEIGHLPVDTHGLKLDSIHYVKLQR